MIDGDEKQRRNQLAAEITALAKDMGTDAVPGLPPVQRQEQMRQINQRMVREGHFEVRRRGDGSTSLHVLTDDAVDRFLELIKG